MDTEVITAEEMQAPAPPPAPNSSKAAWIVAGVATAVALVAAMVAVSAVMREDDNATNPPAGFQTAGLMRPVTGEITDIDGTSFEVEETAPNGESSTTEVDTTTKTTFRESVKGSLSDLAVGDTIVATGTTADNVFTATQINENTGQTSVVRGDGPAMGGDGPGMVFNGAAPRQRLLEAGPANMRLGTITKIEGDTITIDGFGDQSVAVKTTSGTEIRVNKSIKLSNLKVGDRVRVFGTLSGDKLTANEVTKGVTDDALAS